MIKSQKILALAAATTLTIGSMSSVMFAQVNGETRLTAEVCNTIPVVEAYDIDYGTFLASEVQGVTHTNVGAKANNTLGAGISRTPDNGSGDYYVFIDQECPNKGWESVQVQVSAMTDQGGVVGATDIPANNQKLSSAIDGQLYLFNSTADNQDDIPNGSITVATNAAGTTFGTTALTVLNRNTAINNGRSGEYGALLAHELEIPSNQVPSTYKGTFTVTCVNCN